MTSPVLVVVTDFEHHDDDVLLGRIRRACERARPGTVLVQLRDRALSARRRFNLGSKLVLLARATSQLMVVNDRIDIALALGADGVHLTEASVGPRAARRIFEKAFVSRASHDPASSADGVDAVLLAPIFEARHGRPALGVDALRRARATLDPRVKLYALGGVSAANAKNALAAGADGVAVMGAVSNADADDLLLEALGIARGASGNKCL